MFKNRKREANKILQWAETLVDSCGKDIQYKGAANNSSYPESGPNVYEVMASGKFLFAIDVTDGVVIEGVYENQKMHYIGRKKCRELLGYVEYAIIKAKVDKAQNIRFELKCKCGKLEALSKRRGIYAIMDSDELLFTINMDTKKVIIGNHLYDMGSKKCDELFDYVQSAISKALAKNTKKPQSELAIILKAIDRKKTENRRNVAR